MNDFQNLIFHYLERENINIDNSEFLFQYKSHPDFPSLLAISDTLTFFNINNVSLNVNNSNLTVLPSRFITFVKDDKKDFCPCYVEKKKDIYICLRDSTKKILSHKEFLDNWKNIILIIDNSSIVKKTKKTNSPKIISISWMLFFIGIHIYNFSNFEFNLFTIFSFLGLGFSILALKDIFGTDYKFVRNFCNLSLSTSCVSIINSNRWKIFKVINFADLGLVFFSTQILSFYFFMFLGRIDNFFNVQKPILIISIPIIFISLYFQKFVEKKWCPICLAIIGIFLSELIYVFLISTKLEFVFYEFIIYVFSTFFVVLIWYSLKELLVKLKKIKELQLKSNRFMHDYEVFKAVLISAGKFKLINSQIVLGNVKSKNVLTILTSPFCGYCQDFHKIIESIINNKVDVRIEVIFPLDLNLSNESSKKLLFEMISAYYKNGEYEFMKVLTNWFENKIIPSTLIDDDQIAISNEMFLTHHVWCKKEGFFFTPTVFINGYKFPDKYTYENLEFFVNEMSEDEYF